MRILLAGVVLAFGIGVSSAAAAEKTHTGPAGVGGFRFMETEHFKIYYQNNNPEPAKSWAEKSWKETARALLKLNQKFDGSYRKLTIYMVDSNAEYNRIVAATHKNRPDSGKLISMGKKVSWLHLSRSMFVLDRSRMQRTKKNLPVYLSHSLGSSLLGYYMQTDKQIPFWLWTGFGYYIEFKLHHRTVTHMISYDGYEKRMEEAEKLKSGKGWVRVVKGILEKEGKIKMYPLFAASAASLNPKTVGYIYALTSYLVSNKKRRKNFIAFLKAFGEKGGTEHYNDLLAAYSIKNMGKLEKSLKKFIGGDKFK